MTILDVAKAVSDNADQRIARGSRDFLAVAWGLMASRSHNITWAEYADQMRLAPKVADVLKAVVPPSSTTGPSAAIFGPMARAFVESLKQASVLDRLLPFAVQVPMPAMAIALTTAFTAGPVAEGGAKPLSSLNLAGNTLTPRKVAGLVAGTSELFKLSDPAAMALFDSALRQAVVAACNSALLSGLISLGPAAIPSSGTTAANVMTDLGALLDVIQVGEGSRLFMVMSGAAVKGLATMVNGAGVLAFPKVDFASGGFILPGIGLIISNSLPAGAALMVDASGLILGDEGITLDSSRNASLEMESTPANPSTASTVMLSLWSSNLQALRCERTFGYALGRAGSIASLSGVNY